MHGGAPTAGEAQQIAAQAANIAGKTIAFFVERKHFDSAQTLAAEGAAEGVVRQYFDAALAHRRYRLSARMGAHIDHRLDADSRLGHIEGGAIGAVIVDE